MDPTRCPDCPDTLGYQRCETCPAPLTCRLCLSRPAEDDGLCPECRRPEDADEPEGEDGAVIALGGTAR